MRSWVLVFMVANLMAAFILSCGGGPVGFLDWDLMHFSQTGQDPEVGTYSTSYGGTFRVFIDEESGAKMIGFGEHAEPIMEGEFRIQWGDASAPESLQADPNNPNFHCPDDAFAASGHFLTPTNAQGQYREGQNCRITMSVDFSAAKSGD